MAHSSNSYSLSKSRNILQTCYDWYKKNWQSLPSSELQEVEHYMEKLDAALIEGNPQVADPYAKRIDEFYRGHYKKSFSRYTWEILTALILALLIAGLIRATWFEPYEIPTGSMRPTFAEKDRLIVSKTTFGINMPTETDHILFEPDLVQRSSVFVFSADQMPVHDADTTYFGILPYKKRLIKRLMGKPGDTLYFYGGKIYGMDKAGNFLPELATNPWTDHLEYIPFMNFEGEVSQAQPGQLTYKMFNIPIGRISAKDTGELTGEVFNGKEWVKDRPKAALKPHNQIETYSDLFGLRNFAMTRLLNKQQVQELYSQEATKLDEAPLYLEIRHSQSLTTPRPTLVEEGGGWNILLTPQISLLPLQEQHIDQLMNAMYTARFDIKNGRARRYSVTPLPYGSFNPRFAGVADGTYELYFGKAYQIGFGGTSSELPTNSPLLNRDPAHVQMLYNLGIDLNNAFEPHASVQRYLPHRYAYFRDGDLYAMGAPLMKKGDPILDKFLKQEEEKVQDSKGTRVYIPFKDYGSPLKDGKLDVAFMNAFGLKVPEGHYLALGDNHAMSGDSRVFGFVPQGNLEGAPSFIIWPFGPRWGIPLQKPYPWITLPNLIIWGLALLIFLGWLLYRYLGRHEPIYQKLSPNT